MLAYHAYLVIAVVINELSHAYAAFWDLALIPTAHGNSSKKTSMKFGAWLRVGLAVNLALLRSEIRHQFEKWMVRFNARWVVVRVGMRIKNLEADGSRTRRTDFYELSQNYEVVAMFFEYRGQFEKADLVTMTHGKHPMLPADMHEGVFVRAGLRAVRQRRIDAAAKYLELAKSVHVPQGAQSFFELLESALRRTTA
jgi:hypothetical protein